MKLFEQYNSLDTTEIIQKIRSLSDELNGDSEKAFEAVFYTMVAALVRRSNSHMSTGMLLSQLKKAADSNILKDFNYQSDWKDAKKLTAYIDFGNKNISQVFPAVKSPLLSMVTSYAGTGKKETINYTGFVTSLLMQMLQKNIDDDKLKTESFADFLKSHHEPLFNLAPDNLIDKMIPALGMHELRKMKVTYSKKDSSANGEEIEGEQNTYVDDEAGEGTKFNMKYLWLGLALLGILAISYFIYLNKDSLVSDEENPVSEVLEEDLTEQEAVSTTDTTLTDTLKVEKVAETNNADLANLTAAIGESFTPNKLIEMNSLTFDANAMDLSEKHNATIESVYNLMAQNPGMQIQILGNAKDLNRQVALKRAFNLKRALQAKGIEQIRIDAAAGDKNVDYLVFKLISK